MKTTVGILIDLGNSENRVDFIIKEHSIKKEITNRFVRLARGYEIANAYDDKRTTMFKYDNSYYTSGRLAEREFNDQILTPSGKKNKSKQLTSELSFNVIFAHALYYTSDVLNAEIKDLDVTFNVSLLLPALEHRNEKKQELIKKMIRDIKSVSMTLPYKIETEFKIGRINLYPEGFPAFIAVRYKYDKKDKVIKPIPEMKKFAEGRVLILDIGAGTTDLLVIEDNEIVLQSRDSIKEGGDTVLAHLKRDINLEYDFVPTDMQTVLKTGKIKKGSRTIDIIPLLNKAKMSYVNKAIKQLKPYINLLPFSMNDLKGLLVVGGGSLDTKRKGKVVSKSISSFLIDELKEDAPYMEEISIGNLNPRLVNIEGMRVIYLWEQASM